MTLFSSRLFWLVLSFLLVFFCWAEVTHLSTEASEDEVKVSILTQDIQSRVELRDDNILIVGGEPFFPLGAYREPNDTLTDFSGIKAAGFNLLHDYRFEDANPALEVQVALDYLKGAHKNGLKIFMGINRQWIKDKCFNDIGEWVRELMNSPALLTWYLYDEPDHQGIDFQQLERVNELVKSIDPYHPSSIVLALPKKYSQYAKVSDILWVDPYPMGKVPLTVVAERVRLARLAAGPDRPVWIVLQAHSPLYKEFRENRERALKVYGKPQHPTPEETRFMAFSALAAGANGLLWYWCPSTWYHIQKDADEMVWQGIVSTLQEMKALMPFLTARITPDDDISIEDPFLIWTREADEKRVFVFNNASSHEAKLSFDMGRFNVLSVQFFDEESDIILQEGKLSVTFAPYGVKIYMIESAK